MTTTITDPTTSRRSTRSLRTIEKGLDGIAGGGHFFDLPTDDVITTPGYLRRVEGRNAVAEMYRPYGTMIVLDRCHDLAVDHDIKDAVLSTWTLCTIPNMDAALAEI
jgi:hypothetical protein